MFGIHNNTAPSYLCDVQPVNHNYGTRGSTLSYTIPRVNSHGQHSFKFISIKAWNSLPLNVKKCDSKFVFKSRCKAFLMEKMKGIEESEFIYY